MIHGTFQEKAPISIPEDWMYVHLQPKGQRGHLLQLDAPDMDKLSWRNKDKEERKTGWTEKWQMA